MSVLVPSSNYLCVQITFGSVKVALRPSFRQKLLTRLDVLLCFKSCPFVILVIWFLEQEFVSNCTST